MKRDAVERPPEVVGVVDVVLPGEGPASHVHDGGVAHAHGDAVLLAGEESGAVVLSLTGLEIRLNTKQAYHLGAALMRARARALRRLS